MRMTKENKEWVSIAIDIGWDNVERYADRHWEIISEPFWDFQNNCVESAKGQGVFFNTFMRFYTGPKITTFEQLCDIYYDNDETHERTKTYAHKKIEEAFCEIRRRLLNE